MRLRPLGTPARLLCQLVRDVDFRDERNPRFVVGAYGGKGAHLLYFRPGHSQTQAKVIKPSALFPTAVPGRAMWAVCHGGDGKVHCIASSSDEVQAYRYDLDVDRLEEFPFTVPYDRYADPGSKFKHFYAFRLCLSPFGGLLYGGGYPDCRLYAWNRTTGEFIDFGRIDEEENYLKWPCPLFEDKIYCGIGSHAKLIEFDLRTQQKRTLLSPADLKGEFLVQLSRWGDCVVGIVHPHPRLVVYDPASDRILQVIEVPDEEDLYVNDQRNLIILGDEAYVGALVSDNLYRVDLATGRIWRIGRDVGGPFGITEGRYLWCHSAIDRITLFDLSTNRVVERFPCSYSGDGMEIFAADFGPDGRTIYGGSFITQSFFRFDPVTKESHEYGQALNLPGQVNSLQAWGDKIFIGHYVHATVTEYDTKKPWQPLDKTSPNPRRLFSLLDAGQDRIWDMKLASDDRIYMACGATYGKLGGALVRFDPKSYAVKAFPGVIPEQTLWCIETGIPGKAVIGSWISGGLGQRPMATEGMVAIFDLVRGELEQLIIPVPGAKNVTALAAWRSGSSTGQVIGTADNWLFVYDPAVGEVVFRDSHSWGDTADLCASRDGWVYGVAQRAVYRFDPSRDRFEKVLDFDCDGFVDRILENRDGNLFITSRTELYRLERAS